MNDQNISLAATAALAGVDASWLCRHRAELPTAVPAHTGEPGRPYLAYTTHDLAAFALEHTAHLSEAECRLALAIARATQKRHRKTAGFCAGATDPITGQVELVRIYAEPSLEPQP
ncbi:hypothetical protein HP546_29320 [Pseudomonas sp. CM25]|uniref:hypothetical protein n=1 Tax=Pseudomonas sp. CM25 TaxID=2738448 RepID=UPI001556CD58|nr:hypothetical protein [Pseudomonas sp. CM25]NQD59438.1 hypothetical protein [Pseudomonas sp. CM25]